MQSGVVTGYPVTPRQEPAQIPGRAYASQSASTGTWLVVDVGWLDNPCLSNF